MKKVVMVILLLLIFLVACNPGAAPDGESNGEGETTDPSSGEGKAVAKRGKVDLSIQNNEFDSEAVYLPVGAKIIIQNDAQERMLKLTQVVDGVDGKELSELGVFTVPANEKFEYEFMQKGRVVIIDTGASSVRATVNVE